MDHRRERHQRITVISEGILGRCSECDVWCYIGPDRAWRLDETEGPTRRGEPCPPVSRSIYPTVLRNKLELFTELPGLLHHAETNSATNDERDIEVSSTGSIKDDAEAFSHGNGNPLGDEFPEDKHRRVRYEPGPGDVIEAVSIVCRVSGMDSYRTDTLSAADSPLTFAS